MTAVTESQTMQMIAAAEVWTPLDGDSGIQLAQAIATPGLNAALPAVGETLLGGEGLAGQAWAREIPLLVDRIATEDFANADALLESGITAAAALPMYDHGRVSAVLLLYLRGGVRAAIELWAGRSGQHELGMVCSYYGDLERFGNISPYVNFPMGSGLPGKVWQTGRPQVMEGLAQSSEFLRSTGAENEGLTTGFGLPLIRGLELRGVLLTLDSQVTSAAQVYEVWEPTMAGQAAAMCRRQAASSKESSRFARASEALKLQPGEGLVGQAWASRRPELTNELAIAESGRASVVEADGLSFGLAIPVLIADEVRAVAMLAW